MRGMGGEMTPYDVIVIGMGPAGAMTAAELGRAGLSVLGLEWKPVPRYKVCGGGLSARIDRVLGPDFHQVVERIIHTVRFQFAGSESFSITSPAPIAYMVMRDRFDAHLVEKARAAGAQVQDDERVIGLSEDSDGVDVRTARGLYRGGIVVGSDGAGSVVARTLFPRRRGRVWGAIEGEIPVSLIPSRLGTDTIALDIGAAAGGYAWVFPKGEQLSVGVAEFHGAGGHPKRSYDRFLQEEPSLTGLVPPRGLGHPIPLYGGPSAEDLPLTTARSVLVGDAAHLVDPVLGEGIYYAVLSGQMAAAAIVNHHRGLSPDLGTYDAQVARELYPEFRVAARMAQSLYRFPHISHRVMRRRPEMLDLYAEVLKGNETYRSFYAKGRAWAKDSFANLLKEACLAAFKG
jgi:geranylgeranyl reductase family protein